MPKTFFALDLGNLQNLDPLAATVLLFRFVSFISRNFNLVCRMRPPLVLSQLRKVFSAFSKVWNPLFFLPPKKLLHWKMSAKPPWLWWLTEHYHESRKFFDKNWDFSICFFRYSWQIGSVYSKFRANLSQEKTFWVDFWLPVPKKYFRKWTHRKTDWSSHGGRIRLILGKEQSEKWSGMTSN